jgi:type I restriction enzyme S subunit
MKMRPEQQDQEFKETELGWLPEKWEVTSIGEVCDVKSGGTPSTAKKEYWTQGDIPWIKSGQCQHCYVSKAEQFITKEGLENCSAKMFKQNTVLVAMVGATVGKTGFLTISACSNQNVAGLFPKEDARLDSLYLFFCLQSRYNEFTKTKGFIIANLSFIRNLKIPVPSLAEQRQMAYILSAIKKAQLKTENVINSLKELKKSLMKHLFTYGTVNLGDKDKVKIKETEIGVIPESWEETKVKYCCKQVLTGGTPRTEVKEYYEPKEIPWMKSGEIQGKRIRKIDTWISRKGLENSNARILPRNSVVIALAGRGKTRGTTSILDVDCACNQSVICMVLDEDKLVPEFLHYYLSNLYLYIRNLTGDKDRSGLNKEIVGNLPLFLPKKPEQEKIASILSAIDTKIETEERKEGATNELFKSMLFDLMSAKIRVSSLEA